MSVIRTLPLPEPVPILTSGEVGQDIVDTMRVIESAVRRCGKSPSVLTAEDLDTAKTNLHLILSSLSNRGINLWAVDRQLLPVVRGQAAYTMPIGTEKIVNIVYRTNRRLEATQVITSGFDFCAVTMAQTNEFNMLGFKLPEEYSGRLIMEYVLEGNPEWQEYRSFGTVTLDKGWHWYSFDPAVRARSFRIRDLDDQEISVEDIALYDSQQDRDIARLNRDMYTALPDKARLGRPNSYYFDKLIESQLILWPVPQDEEAQVVIWRQRRIHDVGSLVNKLEVPERWLEAITWALAKNLAYELQGVTTERITLCTTEAANTLRDAELGESDQAPMSILPNISGYTA